VKLALFLFPLVLWTTPAYGENLDDEAVPPGEDVIVAIKKGQPAPFAGQLFDINTAIRWGLWLKNCRERAELELDRDKALCQTELNYQHEVAATQVDQLEQLNVDLKTRLHRSEEKRLQAEHDLANPPWYESRLFWFALGAVTVGGFVSMTVVALN
jgi:hypothetical protein